MYRKTAMVVFFAGMLGATPCLALSADDKVTAGPFIEQQIAWLRNKLAPQIGAALKKYRVPRLSLALVRGHEVLWSEGFGYADLAQRRPARSTSINLSTLCACMAERTFDLIPYPNGWFGVSQDALAEFPRSFSPFGQMPFRSERIGDREVVVGQLKEKRILLGEKVPATEIPRSWLQRVGRYGVLNPDRDFPVTEPKLNMRDGQLCMSYKMLRLSDKAIQVPLRPISDTEAIVLGIGRSRGETLRAVSVDGEEALRYWGFVGQKLK